MSALTAKRQGGTAAKWDRCSTKRRENAIGREMFPSGKNKKKKKSTLFIE